MYGKAAAPPASQPADPLVLGRAGSGRTANNALRRLRQAVLPPPRPDCPDCLGQRTEWQILSAGGTLYSRTRIHVVPESFIEAAPLDVGIIDQDAGLRFLCWLVEGAQTVPLDSRLELVALRYANGTVFGARPEVTGNA